MKRLNIIKKIDKFNVLWLLIFIFIFLLVLSFFIRPKSYSIRSIDIKNLKGLILDNNTTITQNFSTNSNYSSIGFLASSDGNYVNNGYINIFVIDNKRVMKKVKMSASEICDDNYYYKYYYVKYNFKKGRNYTIKITADNMSDNILIGKTSRKLDHFSLFKNDILQNGNMAISFTYKTDNKFCIWYYLIIISLLITGVIILRMKGIDYEKSK